jgi:WhiB family redox-sensing transcriptional regulator
MTTVIRRPITSAARDVRWDKTARCRYEDPELFFPIGISPTALQQAEEARAVCQSCPLVEACLEWALETREPFGVFGGMTADERRDLRPSPASAVPGQGSPSAARCWDAEDDIRLWRSQGVSQREMADRLGIGKSVLSRWIKRYDEAHARAAKRVAA